MFAVAGRNLSRHSREDNPNMQSMEYFTPIAQQTESPRLGTEKKPVKPSEYESGSGMYDQDFGPGDLSGIAITE